MNIRMVRFILGWVLRFESIFLCLPILVAVIYGERQGIAYVIVALLCLLLSWLCTLKKPEMNRLCARDGFASVALSWIVMSAFGALPFVMTKEIPNFVDAMFETISGFTTTGASILTNVEALSYTSLFWRSFTHWIGGMGVFVFIMAVLPLMGGTDLNLMKAESPGPSVGKFVPKVKDTAKILYSIYIFITVLEIVLLLIFGMPLFDALTSTFGTVGTGGFGIKNDSFASYAPALQNIVTIFMVLSGMNFTFYFLLLRKKFSQACKMEEIRVYLAIIAITGILVCVFTRPYFATIGATIRHSFFQVASIITTTGFATTDFNLWPQFPKTILVILMFVGACAGSTGGGMKVSRFIIVFKTIRKEISILIHPRTVKKIQMDGVSIPHETVRATNVYIASYFMVFFISVLVLGIDNLDFTTNFTAVAATFNNIGPGMELVGPTSNYAMFSPICKLILCFDMLAGRLEIFPILMLFSRRSWKRL
ncbi:MAG: TrkH family potassium uptake protein [Hespellia sp.]|nr:TrkH family potassium uptake protein [Hespellia sp.]